MNSNPSQLAAAATDMLAALIVAREFISTDRTGFADCNARHDGSFEACDALVLKDYDDALLQINAAILKAGAA